MRTRFLHLSTRSMPVRDATPAPSSHALTVLSATCSFMRTHSVASILSILASHLPRQLRLAATLRTSTIMETCVLAWWAHNAKNAKVAFFYVAVVPYHSCSCRAALRRLDRLEGSGLSERHIRLAALLRPLQLQRRRWLLHLLFLNLHRAYNRHPDLCRRLRLDCGGVHAK